MSNTCSCRQRRRFLQLGLATGAGLLLPSQARAGNIRELTGPVYINKQVATPDSQIWPGDLVTTSHTGRIAFTVDNDAFLLKERTSLQVGESGDGVVSLLQLLTGKLLSVFETGRDRRIITPTSTIGIRGTACFMNVVPDSIYYCNCYGQTTLTAGGKTEHFEATRHSAHQIDFDGDKMMGMQVMAVIDHSDDELRQLEGFVGRVPAFDR